MNISQSEYGVAYRNDAEFFECIAELLELSDVQQLSNFAQHCKTNRLEHSLNVAYYSYKICKRLGLDYRSAARAGVLHDLFLYDWRKEKQPEGNHAKAHPRVALRNAEKIADLNKVEKDAIVKHMWPLTVRPPRYKESMIVSMADKYSACYEVAVQISGKLQRKAGKLKKLMTGEVFAR